MPAMDPDDHRTTERKKELNDVSDSEGLPSSASTNTRDVEDNGSQHLVVDATDVATAKPAAAATTTVIRGVLPNFADPPPDTAPHPPTKRLGRGRGRGRFQALKGHQSGRTPMSNGDHDQCRPVATRATPTPAAASEATADNVDSGAISTPAAAREATTDNVHPGANLRAVDTESLGHSVSDADAVVPSPAAAREATTDNVDPGAYLRAVDTESLGRSLSDPEAVVPSRPEATTLSTSIAPIWEAYLAPESGLSPAIEVVDAVVCDDTVIPRSDRRKWALLLGAFLLVGAVIAVSLWWRTRNVNEDRSVTPVVTVIDPPLSAPTTAPTTILSWTQRLGDIIDEILTHFESPTLAKDLTNLQSPQYRAALWMAAEDMHPATANLAYPLNQSSLGLLQFRQRYALATFYYATDGDGWLNPCNFLSPSRHVCDWNCEPPDQTSYDLMGVDCDSDSLVLSLFLGT